MGKEFRFNDHHDLANSHAIISPSRHNFLADDYDSNRFDQFVKSSYATQIGTAIHELASQYVKRKKRLNVKEARTLIDYKLYLAGIPQNAYDPDDYVPTFVPYVRDAVGYDMEAEQVLEYSRWAFGTTDAIRVNLSKGELRIHDLKTGKAPASLDQLVCYASLFFLEYHLKPGDFKVTLCIYQNGNILTGLPDTDTIAHTMDRIRMLSDYYERTYRQ